MAEDVKPRFLPTLALDIARWFPELGGRAIAVSEARQVKDMTLPLVMVALARENNADSRLGANATRKEFTINDAFVVEFWLEPVQIKRDDGSETPFWSYYDYEAIRDRLLAGVTHGYRGPNCERISYVNMTMESDEYAVTLTFAFLATFQWQASDELIEKLVIYPDGQPITSQTFTTNICKPRIVCLPPCEDADGDCDPCKPILDRAAAAEDAATE